MNIAETSDYGVLRLIVDAPSKAAALLREHGYIVRETAVVQAPVPDRPGGLSDVLKVVSGAGIDLEYMYSVLGQQHGLAYMVFKVAAPEKLDAVLAKIS